MWSSVVYYWCCHGSRSEFLAFSMTGWCKSENNLWLLPSLKYFKVAQSLLSLHKWRNMVSVVTCTWRLGYEKKSERLFDPLDCLSLLSAVSIFFSIAMQSNVQAGSRKSISARSDRRRRRYPDGRSVRIWKEMNSLKRLCALKCAKLPKMQTQNGVCCLKRVNERRTHSECRFLSCTQIKKFSATVCFTRSPFIKANFGVIFHQSSIFILYCLTKRIIPEFPFNHIL